MARVLDSELDRLHLLASTRRPAYTIEVYDIRSTSTDVVPTRIGDVVRLNLGSGVGVPEIVGPRDFTDDVEFIDMVETAGDYVDSGVAASQITFQVADPYQNLDPVNNPPTVSDPEANGRWLRQGNVVVVREGDLAIDPGLWPITFTGSLVGQPGQDSNRTTGVSRLTCKALSREQDFLRTVNTSLDFAQGTTYQSMAEDLAEIDMGLDVSEIAFPTFSAEVTAFATTQFVDESPLVSIAKILLVDGFLPRFDGYGRLTASSGSITQSPIRFYDEPDLIERITRPFLAESGINEVEVIGLDPVMSQVIQPQQVLARASITTGFFSTDASIPVKWSEDGTLQAINVSMQVDASVGDALFSFGGESFTNSPSALDGGSTGGTIDVDGGFNLILVGLVLVSILAAHKVPDIAPPLGGPTIPVGRVIEGGLIKLAMSILATQGRGQYRIVGQPYEYVFQEIRATVRKQGILSQDRRPIEIENHLVNSQANANIVAERIFRRERAKQNRRSVAMIHDLALEPDDVFQVGSGASVRRYLIASITRRLQRGGDHLARLECYEVTPGVLP